MSYREKECPHCGTKHRKRGPYCSRSCGNHRTWTKKQKEVFSEKKREYLYNTDEGEVERWQINNQHVEDELIQPQVTQELEYGQFVEDGDIWEEV
jgi:hypothetical protein